VKDQNYANKNAVISAGRPEPDDATV